MSTKLTSNIWIYFQINASDNSKATCKLCRTSVSRGGKNPKQWMTSNLTSHIKNRHVVEYGQLQRERTSTSMTSSPLSSVASIASPSTSASSSSIGSPSSTSGSSLVDALDRMKKWDFNDPRALAWNKLIGEFIAVDTQPFTVLEDVGFRRLVAKAEPRYKLPSPKYFSTSLIPDMYEAVIGKVRQLISSVKHLSFTTDAWSDPSSSVALLSLTVHWISDDFIRQQTVLFATPLEESHTGEYLSVKFTEMLDSFSIEKARVHLVLRDSGANMVKALRLAEVDDLPCFAHQLQLVINDSILSQRAVKDILALA